MPQQKTITVKDKYGRTLTIGYNNKPPTPEEIKEALRQRFGGKKPATANRMAPSEGMLSLPGVNIVDNTKPLASISPPLPLITQLPPALIQSSLTPQLAPSRPATSAAPRSPRPASSIANRAYGDEARSDGISGMFNAMTGANVPVSKEAASAPSPSVAMMKREQNKRTKRDKSLHGLSPDKAHAYRNIQQDGREIQRAAEFVGEVGAAAFQAPVVGVENQIANVLERLGDTQGAMYWRDRSVKVLDRDPHVWNINPQILTPAEIEQARTIGETGGMSLLPNIAMNPIARAAMLGGASVGNKIAGTPGTIIGGGVGLLGSQIGLGPLINNVNEAVAREAMGEANYAVYSRDRAERAKNNPTMAAVGNVLGQAGTNNLTNFPKMLMGGKQGLIQGAKEFGFGTGIGFGGNLIGQGIEQWNRDGTIDPTKFNYNAAVIEGLGSGLFGGDENVLGSAGTHAVGAAKDAVLHIPAVRQGARNVALAGNMLTPGLTASSLPTDYSSAVAALNQPAGMSADQAQDTAAPFNIDDPLNLNAGNPFNCVQAGATNYQDGRFPSARAQRAVGQEIERGVKAIPGVRSVRAPRTYGRYAGTNEPSFDIEAEVDDSFVRDAFNDYFVQFGKQNNQDAVFTSRVLHLEEDHPNARPGIEITFAKPITNKQAARLVDELSDKGSMGTIIGFSFVTNKEGEVQGLRSQFVPEFAIRFGADNNGDLMSGDPARVQARMKAAEDAYTDLAGKFKRDSRFKKISVRLFDTDVFTKEDYDDYLGRHSKTNDSATGRKRPGVPLSDRLTKPTGGVRMGSDTKSTATKTNPGSARDSGSGGTLPQDDVRGGLPPDEVSLYSDPFSVGAISKLIAASPPPADDDFYLNEFLHVRPKARLMPRARSIA